MSEFKVPSVPSAKREKPMDASVVTLRHEIQQLYKLLQAKNEDLITLEKAIVHRDMTTLSKTASLQRHIDGNDGGGGGDDGDGGGDASIQSFLSNIECDRMAIASERSDSSTSSASSSPMHVIHASKLETIREQNETIKELNEKVIRLSRHLNFVQRNLQAREERIIELQNENDKFRQIVRPVTEKIFNRKTCGCAKEWDDCMSGIGDWSPGMESTRVLSLGEPRMKRQAISAEPLSSMAGISEEDGLIRIPKSSL